MTSSFVAVADYAAEIEGSVGTEIYGPIFRAGLFLFFSGIVSAFIAAAIITKSNSFAALGEEFDLGKQSQLIESNMETQAVPRKEPQADIKSIDDSAILNEIKDLDL